MDVILCTVSSTDCNDTVVSGLVHFSLSSHLRNNRHVYAIYRAEADTLDLRYPDHSIKKIIPKRELSASRSARYFCIWQLLSSMKRGDRLMTQSFADFGSTSEEAADLYFRAVEKGIELSFYDASYMDSQTLAVDSNPTADESRLIRRIINNYYRQKDITPLLSKDDLSTLAAMPAAKKKSDA